MTTCIGVASKMTEDAEYNNFLTKIKIRFQNNVMSGIPVFTTNTPFIWATYLASLPTEQEAQVHNCNTCKQFFEKYGSLVFIKHDGTFESVMWNIADAPDKYKPAVKSMLRLINDSKITGVFLSDSKRWGTPITGEWTHYSVDPPKSMIFKHSLLNADQAMAEKLEDFRMVNRALADFPLSIVNTVVGFLMTGTLYRDEKIAGPINWFHQLHMQIATVRNHKIQHNIIWKAIATAPTGFCHIRSSVAGSLLEDLKAGVPVPEATLKFAKKMDPTKYQRSQALPSEGNIEQAEKIVARLGIASSLRRRFAKLEEIGKVWEPVTYLEKDDAGVFSHLKVNQKPLTSEIELPSATMTWVKFSSQLLPEVLEMEFFVPSGNANFAAAVTAVDPDAPPILQWDFEDNRNPISHYVWVHGSPASQWGLRANWYCKVNALSCVNNGPNHAESILLVLDGAKDSAEAGLGLFPEILKSELREIRSTIEAFSNKGKLEGKEEATACGYLFSKGSRNSGFNLKVRTKYGISIITIDRWD